MPSKTSDGVVTCLTSEDVEKAVPSSDMTFRPAVYGFVYDGDWRSSSFTGRLLLVRRKNGKLRLPGGVFLPGEPVVKALRRRIMRETGVEVSVDAYYGIEDQFRCFGDGTRARHGIAMFWHCRPSLISNTVKKDGRALYVPVYEVEKEDFDRQTRATLLRYLEVMRIRKSWITCGFG